MSALSSGNTSASETISYIQEPSVTAISLETDADDMLLHTEIQNAVIEQIPYWLARLSPSMMASSGIRRETPLSAISIGAPIRVYLLDDNLNSDTKRFAYPTNQWRVPLLHNNMAVFLLTVEKKVVRYEVTKIGAAKLARELTRHTIARVSSFDANQTVLIRSLVRQTDFIQISFANGASITRIIQPEQDEPSGETSQKLPQPTKESSPVILDISVAEQEHNQWCWAASIQTVLLHYGIPASQCEIANQAAILSPSTFGTEDCCDFFGDFDAMFTCNHDNAFATQAGSIAQLLDSYQIDNDSVFSALGFDEVASLINEGRPFIAHLIQQGVSGHFVVVHGYQDSDVRVVYFMDPWPGEGFSISTYEWLLSGSRENSGMHTWLHTNIVGTGNRSFAESSLGVQDLQDNREDSNISQNETQLACAFSDGLQRKFSLLAILL